MRMFYTRHSPFLNATAPQNFDSFFKCRKFVLKQNNLKQIADIRPMSLEKC